MKALATLFVIGMFATTVAIAETFTSVNSGSWLSPVTWRDGNNDPGVPGVADDKFVNHIVTISSPVTNSGRIQINNGTLTISSTFTNNGFFDGMTTNGLDNFGGTVSVTATGIVQNNGLYNNLNSSLSSGTTTIDVGGQFFNNYASGNGHLHNEEGTITVKGRLTNSGDIHQLTNGILVISDSPIQNNGILDNTGSNAVFDNRSGATITISGTIFNESGGTIDNNSGGTINNSGTISNRHV